MTTLRAAIMALDVPHRSPVHWISRLGPELLALPAECAVAEDCLKVIEAANNLIDRCADVAPKIYDAAAHQCRIFYFG